MVWWLHCAWIPFARSSALDVGADFTSALHRSRRRVSSEVVAPQIAGARRAGTGHCLLCGTTGNSTQRRTAYTRATQPSVLSFVQLRLLRVSHSWRFGK